MEGAGGRRAKRLVMVTVRFRNHYIKIIISKLSSYQNPLYFQIIFFQETFSVFVASLEYVLSSYIRVISSIWMQLPFFVKALFWVSGDNLGLKGLPLWPCLFLDFFVKYFPNYLSLHYEFTYLWGLWSYLSWKDAGGSLEGII